jgi:endonuclease G
MAKKKASPTRKKAATKKKKSNDSSNKSVFLILLLIIAAGLVIYGLKETDQFSGSNIFTKNTPVKVDKSAKSTANTKVDKSEPTEVEEEEKSKAFDSNDISAKDNLVESSSTNDNLPDYSNADQYYYTKSFDFNWPAYGQSDAIVEHQYYTFSYNEKTEQPIWVAYTLSKKNLDNAQFKRKDDFRSDPDVSSQSAALADYKGSGYDRGHLAPAADFTWDKEALSETFYMSNMSPQDPGFNRGIWKKLEGKVRGWAKSNHQIHIVTGPIFKSMSKKIGDNKVAVPSHYYKVILDIQEPEIKGIAFVLRNKKNLDDIMKYAISIDKLEEQTGIDFFPSIPDDLENKIERKIDKSLW